MRKPFALFALTAVVSSAFAQQLTIDDALKMGLQHNGTLLAAQKQVRAARARLNEANAAFFPTLTAQVDYGDQTTTVYKTSSQNPATGSFKSSGTTETGKITWNLLDTGERSLGVRSARASLRSQEATAINTLRQTLFAIYQEYIESLRAQETLKVNQAQVDRAETVRKQTEAEAKAGSVAANDVFQPRADELTARFNAITAQNNLITNKATLKASINWPSADPLPELVPVKTTPVPPLSDLKTTIERGLSKRPDLIAERYLVEEFRLAKDLAKVNAGPTFSLSANAGRSYGFADQYNRNLSALVSWNVFDGGLLRSRVAEQAALEAAERDRLAQAEKAAAADIESALASVQINTQRLEAAQLALDAARINYERTTRARELGAKGVDVVTVSTARATLVTAETNYISALYDNELSVARLKLVTGEPVPGEQ